MQEEQQNRLSAAQSGSDLSASERRAVDQQSRASAALIHETIRIEGEEELERKASSLLLSAVAAGLSIGFSALVPAILQAGLPDTSWRHLVTSLGYTVGFLIVVLGRQQLFTENTLTPVLPVLHTRTLKLLGQLLRLWGIVLVGNIVATWVFSSVVAHAPIVSIEVKDALLSMSRQTIESPFGETLMKAAFAGWLIALMVWLLPAAETARPFIIVILAYVVSIGHFSHIIVGSVEASFLVNLGEAGFTDYALRFFLPTLIGNVVGGVALVAILNYGQVVAELKE